MKKNTYAVNLALEASRMTSPLLRSQHKRVKIDRWRKLSKYLGRAISGRNDGATNPNAYKPKWLKWKKKDE